MCLRFVRFALRCVLPVREEGETDEDGVQLNSYIHFFIILMIILYNLAQLVGLILFLPFICVIVIINAKYRKVVPARLGFGLDRLLKGQNIKRPRIWIHALSAGEVLSAVPLVKAVRRAYPQAAIFFSATTATGKQLATQTIAQQVDLFVPFPLDLFFCVKRFIRRLAPDFFILIETDFWPNFIYTLKKNNIPCLLANGRFSQSSYDRYQKLRPLFTPLFASFRFISMQTEADVGKMINLGVPADKIRALGNLKYDAALSGPTARGHHMPTDNADRTPLSLPPAKTVWVAGSTHPGEELIIFNTYKRLQKLFPDLFLVLAPRKIERTGNIAALAARLGLNPVRRSRPGAPASSVLLLDTLGELSEIYSLCKIAFIGGSLVRAGGHNPLEAAALGKPVIFGPHMDDFAEISHDLLEVKGAAMAKNEEELFGLMQAWLTDGKQRKECGEQALALVDRQRGVTARHMDIINKILAARGAS